MLITPENKKKLARFKEIKRGYYSLIVVLILIVFSLFAEFFINNKALIVVIKENITFQLGKFYSGETFGLDYSYEADYKELKKISQEKADLNLVLEKNWVLLPFIPYSPYENDFSNEVPPAKPSFANRHLLGTDLQGRDVLARVVYGFRIAIFFSLALYILSTIIGVFLGCLMGYFGGIFDLIFQRIVEIWTSLPLLYILIIMAALITPSIGLLLIIFTFF